MNNCNLNGRVAIIIGGWQGIGSTVGRFGIFPIIRKFFSRNWLVDIR